MTLQSLNDELKRIDKTLSCGFNGVKGCYQVIGYDMKNVKYVLYEVPLGKLDIFSPQIIEGIRKGKFFTAKEKNRMLDDAEERDEKQNEKYLDAEMDHATAEGYDILKRMEGLRITLPNTDYFEVRDLRRGAPEPVSSTEGKTMEVSA